MIRIPWAISPGGWNPQLPLPSTLTSTDRVAVTSLLRQCSFSFLVIYYSVFPSAIHGFLVAVGSNGTFVKGLSALSLSLFLCGLSFFLLSRCCGTQCS